MAKYKIIKPVDFGPWTIGSKEFGPNCPSCKVPINNYAPKIGDTIEGEIETATYYQFYDGQKHLKTGRGVKFVIATNGAASTQAQYSIQFITEDHLELDIPLPPTVEPEPGSSTSPASNGPNNPETPYNVGQTVCWICENRVPVLVGLLLLIGLVLLLNKD